MTKGDMGIAGPAAFVALNELEAIRIPRSSALVKGAHQQGESRVVDGIDRCKARNDAVRELWKDTDAVLVKMKDIHAGAIVIKF